MAKYSSDGPKLDRHSVQNPGARIRTTLTHMVLHSCLFLLLFLAAALLSGCKSIELMPTPNLYTEAKDDPFADVPRTLRTTDADILYVTDRKPVQTKDGKLEYSYERSRSLAFGSCLVDIGKGLSWETIAANSRVRSRAVPMPLSVRQINEQGRLPETPIPLIRTETGLVDDPNYEAQLKQAAEKFRSEVTRRLSLTDRKEAFVFIHGNFATFDDAAFMCTDLWHFLGRQGVPILYTWPAGIPTDMLQKYLHDRESGEFTVYHLKSFIRALALCKELKKIHIITHSWGTHVTISALRELFIQEWAAGGDPRKTFKIGNVVLAAPDLDLEVISQRSSAERLFRGVDSATVYISVADKDIGASKWLNVSRQRVGSALVQDLSVARKKELEAVDRLHVVSALVQPEFSSHYYFLESPSVSSDLILLLRYNRDPGAENGRPLIRTGLANYWQIFEGYPGGQKN